MKTYTDEQILENRKTWIEFLKRPETKKYKEQLESRDGSEARCCLGHGCFALGIKRTVDEIGVVRYDGEREYAPESFMDMVGLNTRYGGFGGTSLATINDRTDKTPQEIGAMLESMIMGGEGTPFKEIKCSQS